MDEMPEEVRKEEKEKLQAGSKRVSERVETMHIHSSWTGLTPKL
jgi:hypothetical protein